MTRATDDSAVKDMLVALRPRLRRFAFGLCGCGQDADDLVQSGYARALANLHQWQPGTRLDSWMYRIIQNLYFNRLKADKTQKAYVRQVQAETTSGADRAHAASVQITVDKVLACIDRLPDEQRICLMLVVVQELSYKEAAQVMDSPIGTVMSRLARARANIRGMLEPTKSDEIAE